MAKFEENKLRDEEKSGRFEPGTPDDETLNLEQLDAYPGELPDFTDSDKSSLEDQLDIDIDKESEPYEDSEDKIENPDESQTKEEELSDDSQNEPKEEVKLEETEEVSTEETEEVKLEDDELKTQDSEGDINQEDVKPESDSTEETQKNTTETEATTTKTDKSSVWELFDENENAEDVDSQKDIEESPEEIDEANEDEISIDDLDVNPDDEDSSGGENAIALDDDLIDVLEDDLAKSKANKEEKKAEEKPKEENIDFHSIDDEENVEEIDLTSIETAQHPSSIKEEQETKAPAKKEVKKKEKSKKIPLEKEKKPKKKKDKKKIIIYAATLVASLLFAILLYDWGVNRDGFFDVFGIGGKNMEASKITSEHKIKKVEKKYKSPVKREIEIYEPDESLTNKNIAFVDTQEVRKNETQVIPRKKVNHRVVKIPKSSTKINIKKNIVSKQTISNEDAIDDSDIIAPEITKINFEDSETKHLEKSYNSNKEVVFVVQIYATPSKIDAQDWLNDLKVKGVNDARITEQRLKGKVWYRVRFGQFGTELEAKKAAIRLGFAQSWIDRIK